MRLGVLTGGGDVIADAIGRPHRVDPDGSLARTARGLGVCLGDR